MQGEIRRMVKCKLRIRRSKRVFELSETAASLPDWANFPKMLSRTETASRQHPEFPVDRIDFSKTLLSVREPGERTETWLASPKTKSLSSRRRHGL